LFFNLAEASQALKVAERLEHDFLHGGGFSTTLLRTGQQWDAPNGWAPLQWISFKGLMQYGYTELAGKARSNWLLLNDNTYAETGKMMEKYNVIDSGLLAGGGEYPNQDGFGWTNGVYLALSRYILADVQATPPFSS
jgi:alpha,alpha-trehalase